MKVRDIIRILEDNGKEDRMRRFLAVIEKANGNYSAGLPIPESESFAEYVAIEEQVNS